MKSKVTKAALAATLAIPSAAYANTTPVEIMTEFYKVADARPFNKQALETFFADKFVDHDPSDGKKESSGAKVAATFAELASGSPDSYHKIEFIQPVGDNKALVRWRYIGTQTNSLFGVPASGNKFDIAGMELWEFEQGKISALWHVEELATLFEQITAK